MRKCMRGRQDSALILWAWCFIGWRILIDGVKWKESWIYPWPTHTMKNCKIADTCGPYFSGCSFSHLKVATAPAVGMYNWAQNYFTIFIVPSLSSMKWLFILVHQDVVVYGGYIKDTGSHNLLSAFCTFSWHLMWCRNKSVHSMYR